MNHICLIEETIQEISILGKKIKLSNEQLKHIISICNNLIVRLFQHGLTEKISLFLEKALEADNLIQQQRTIN